MNDIHIIQIILPGACVFRLWEDGSIGDDCVRLPTWPCRTFPSEKFTV